MALEKLKTYWEENIKSNIKKISGIMGDIIITVFTLLLFSVKARLDLITSLIMILFALKPFITLFVNIVFKAEVNGLIKNNLELQQELKYERDIAEYRVQLAARNGKPINSIKSVSDWNAANEKLKSKE